MLDPLKHLPATPEALQAAGRLLRLDTGLALLKLLVWAKTPQRDARPAKVGHTIAEAR